MFSDTIDYLNDTVISQEFIWSLNCEQFENFTSVSLIYKYTIISGQVTIHYELETTL